MIKRLLAFTGILVLSSCGNSDTKDVKETKTDSLPATVVDSSKIANDDFKNNNFNRVAHLLATVKQEDGGDYSSLLNTAVYTKYKQEFDSVKRKINAARLDEMKVFRKEELKDIDSKDKELFYPFSGPDMLNALTFFPDCKNYYLFALEPVGDICVDSKMNEEQFGAYLNDVKTSMNDLFQKGYFITIKMMAQLNKQKANGVLPVMTTAMAINDFQIRNIKGIELNLDGSMVEKEFSQCGENNFRAVKIEFSQKGSSTVQNMFYFKGNISDAGLKKDTALNNFISQKINSTITLVKSASYLMHYGSFNTIRNYVLEKSNYLVQDDTGVPLKYFKDDKFKLTLYGKYVAPIDEFKGVFQKDLDEKYKTDSTQIKRLKFDYGYHWKSDNCNLLVARKK